MGRVEASRCIRASADFLFRAWTDPSELALWWCRDGPGWAFVEARVDARVGGAFQLAMRGPTGRVHVARGQYLEVNPPTRLVFSWDWEHPEDRVGDTLVTVTFSPVSAGSTEVRIVHEGFAAHERRADGHGQGWRELLNRLAALQENSQ